MARNKKDKRLLQNQVEGSRAAQNNQRKKTNLILNILIIIVSLLICGSLYFVFLATDQGQDTTLNKKVASSVNKKEDASSKNKKTEDKEKSDNQKKDNNNENTKISKSDDPNVDKVITKNWQAVGTDQTGNHVNSYVSKSQDWQEKIKAFSEATGIDANNMTLWFVGRGNNPATESIGTISEKNSPDKAYRVYITWQDGKGWQPKKVEELKSNDKRS